MPDHSIKAYVLLVVKGGVERDVAKEIQKIDGVTEVLVIYGLWDIVVRVETESIVKLRTIVTNIRQMPETEQTNTLIGCWSP